MESDVGQHDHQPTKAAGRILRRGRPAVHDGGRISASGGGSLCEAYKEELIYRGERLINWCPRCLTALSDIEVEHEEVKGKLYHIRYPLADDPNTGLIVATTRPETM